MKQYDTTEFEILEAVSSSDFQYSSFCSNIHTFYKRNGCKIKFVEIMAPTHFTMVAEFPLSGWDSNFDGKKLNYNNWGLLIQQKVLYKLPIEWLHQHYIGKMIRGALQEGFRVLIPTSRYFCLGFINGRIASHNIEVTYNEDCDYEFILMQ